MSFSVLLGLIKFSFSTKLEAKRWVFTLKFNKNIKARTLATNN